MHLPSKWRLAGVNGGNLVCPFVLILLCLAQFCNVNALPDDHPSPVGSTRGADSSYRKFGGIGNGPRNITEELVRARENARQVGALVRSYSESLGGWVSTKITRVRDAMTQLKLSDAKDRMREVFRRLEGSAVMRSLQDVSSSLARLFDEALEAGMECRRRMAEASARAWDTTLLFIQGPLLHVAKRVWDALMALLRRVSSQAGPRLTEFARLSCEVAKGLGNQLQIYGSRSFLWISDIWVDASRRGLAATRLACAALQRSRLWSAETWGGITRQLGDITSRAATAWQLSFSGASGSIAASAAKVVDTHKRLFKWYSTHPPAVVIILRSLGRGLRAIFSPPSVRGPAAGTSTAKAPAGESGPSAWWAGTLDGEEGTTSWNELLNSMSAWTSGDAAPVATEKEDPVQKDVKKKQAVDKVKGMAGSAWYITTQGSSKTSATTGVSRYVVLRHGADTFLLLAEDSNGWFRYAYKDKSSIVFPSGLNQDSDHVDAADMVEMLRGKHGETSVGKFLGRSEKQLGNWNLSMVGGGAILVTNDMHTHDPNHPKLVLTSSGMVFMGYSNGYAESQGRLGRTLTREEAEKAVEEAIQT